MPHAVDAIIPVYAESSENLIRTVEGLLGQHQTPDRIVVVDDGSPAPVVLPKQIAPKIELLRLDTNGGIAAARNHGAATSSADFLLFVNCEIFLRSNWLQTGVAFMESHPNVAALGGSIVPQIGSPVLRRWRMRFLENPQQRSPHEQSVTWVTGHAILMRRTMFEEVGGFDPRHRLSWEEYDLCTRLRARGHQVHHVPQLVAESYEVPSIDLFARKTLRNSGWNVNRSNDSELSATIIQPMKLLPASASVIRSLANHSGRNLYKGRLSFLPIDAAVAARSLFLVWSTCLRRLREQAWRVG